MDMRQLEHVSLHLVWFYLDCLVKKISVLLVICNVYHSVYFVTHLSLTCHLLVTHLSLTLLSVTLMSLLVCMYYSLTCVFLVQSLITHSMPIFCCLVSCHSPTCHFLLCHSPICRFVTCHSPTCHFFSRHSLSTQSAACPSAVSLYFFTFNEGLNNFIYC